MGKFMKSGKVVLVLSGRFAGRKAVIVKVRLVLNCFVAQTVKVRKRARSTENARKKIEGRGRSCP
jgi:ribosomal protein L14E/L6E/L27E